MERQIKDFIQEKFGFLPSEKQVESITAYLNQNDVILNAATGFGKSLLFQAAPHLLQHISSRGGDEHMPKILIVSPLVALIADNISKINELKLGKCVNLAESDDIGEATYVFATPESLLDGAGRRVLADRSKSSTIKMVFIDECHVVRSYVESESGTSFRDAYARLGDIRSFIKAPMVGLTATATQETLDYIIESLNLRSPIVIKHNQDRTNISYHVADVEGECPRNFWWLINLILIGIPFRMLIFFHNVLSIGETFDYVKSKIGQKGSCPLERRRVHMFHLDTALTRKQLILQLMSSTCDSHPQVVLCSSSFSLGLNLKNINFVVHYGVPDTIEEYVQETGRAARESNEHGHAILLIHKHMGSGRRVDKAMRAFYKTTECRRKTINEYMGIVTSTPEDVCCDIHAWDLATGSLPIKRLIKENQPDQAMLASTHQSSGLSTPDFGGTLNESINFTDGDD